MMEALVLVENLNYYLVYKCVSGILTFNYIYVVPFECCKMFFAKKLQC